MQYGGEKVYQVPAHETRRLREKSSRYGLVIPVVNEGERIRRQVLDFWLQQSSGHELLDEEVLQMLQRAQPLPQLPEEIQQACLEVVNRVQFHLRWAKRRGGCLFLWPGVFRSGPRAES